MKADLGDSALLLRSAAKEHDSIVNPSNFQLVKAKCRADLLASSKWRDANQMGFSGPKNGRDTPSKN